jgi:hypothetical protein
MNIRDNKLYIIGKRSARVDNENLYIKLRSRGILRKDDEKLIKKLIISYAALSEDFYRLAKIILYDYFDRRHLGKAFSPHIYKLVKFIEKNWINERLETWATDPFKICGITIREVLEDHIDHRLED